MEPKQKKSNLYLVSLYIMAAFYFLAGCYHFINPEFYERFMPGWIPLPYAMVLISGLFEILFGLMLLVRRTRALAAWGIILLLIAVFPANIQLSLDLYHRHDPHLWLS